jgi:hypothetical protein
MRKSPLLAAALAVSVLSACVSHPDAQVTKARSAAPTGSEATLVAPDFGAAAFAVSPAPGGTHGDAYVAATFMELSFAMESGRQLPTFSRFEDPITVALAGQVPGTAPADLSRLISRLRSEAGIDISPAQPGQIASITVEFSPRSDLRRLAPTAACFVVPNVTSLADYKARRGTAFTDWANVAQRQQVAIFVPAEATPQEVRDCLHEEMAQAIGPLNDLYRLSDSVFNDDNFNSTLTGFDMLVLRAYYAPDLRSGMSRAQVQALIGGVVTRLNGGGPGMGSGDLSPTPRGWSDAIATALGGDAGQGARRAAADRALSIARAQGWTDSRLAFSHFAVARLYVGSDRARAVAEFSRAAAIYRGLPGGAIHIAHIDMQLAAIAVASGQPEQALHFADRAIPAVRAAENLALLATTLLIKAEALEMLGRGAEAQALRVDSRASARYGFGTEAQIRAREREISALGGRWGLRG